MILSRLTLLAVVLICATSAGANSSTTSPIVARDVILAEVNGLVAGEAEHFVRQEHTSVRAWHRISGSTPPAIEPDGDPSHADTASGDAYVECLPDTRRTHDDPLTPRENFSNEPGTMAVLSYRIHFSTPGRYYVWLRTFSTTTEDNGAHTGLNGAWPESGQRWQTTQKHAWSWDCRQRTNEVHVGVPMQLWIDVPSAGEHTLQISMREDGLEIDQWLLSKDIAYRPEGPIEPSRTFNR